MVVTGEEDVALIVHQRVVEGLDRLEVEVVCGRVEDERVGIAEHHARDHAAHLLAAGEDAHLLLELLAGEEHAAKEAFEEDLVRVLGELPEPLQEVVVGVEIARIVERQVGRGDRLPPAEGACVRLLLAVDDLEKGRHGARVTTDEDDLIVFLHVEVQVTEERVSIDCFRQTADFQNLVARLASGSEKDARITTRRGLDLLDVELLEHLLAACGLLRLGHVGAESADKLLQLLLLLLGLLVLLLLLAEGQLARLVPEAVVAGEEFEFAKVDVHGVGADSVEEVAVVADDKHRVLEVGQVVLEPRDGLQIEVVRRLIE